MIIIQITQIKLKQRISLSSISIKFKNSYFVSFYLRKKNNKKFLEQIKIGTNTTLYIHSLKKKKTKTTQQWMKRNLWKQANIYIYLNLWGKILAYMRLTVREGEWWHNATTNKKNVYIIKTYDIAQYLSKFLLFLSRVVYLFCFVC